MKYPVIVHKEAGTAYGIVVPDFPGVFSGGEVLDEALENVQDAIETFFDGEEGEVFPPRPSAIEDVLCLEEAKNGAIVVVDVNFDFLEKKTVPVNITLPVYIRNRIDKLAREKGLTRSRLIAEAAHFYEVHKDKQAQNHEQHQDI